MISLRTLDALREYQKRLDAERYLPRHVRVQLLEECRRQARVLLQNVDPRDVEKGERLLAEIESR